MNINWRVRAKNRQFWLALVPAALLLVQIVLQPFGLGIDTEGIGSWAVALVNAIFALLSILGIVTDPTTEGVGDSAQAMGYDEPRKG